MTAAAAALIGSVGRRLTVTATDVLGTSVNPPDPQAVSTTGSPPNPTSANGIGPYTYAWARVSGSTGPAVSNAAIANPTWSNASVFVGAPQTAVWRVTVTDTGTGQTASADINVTLQNV